jgi:hypothetical protein
MASTDREKRIDDLIAKEEIKRLRWGYCAHLDSHDLDSMISMFTEDAVLDFGADYGGSWVGHEEIRRNYTHWMAQMGKPFDALHVVTNPWITLRSDTEADGRWYLLDLLIRQKPHTGLETVGGHANPLVWIGIYEDQYRKLADGWRISRVKLHFLWPTKHMGDLERP